MKILIWGMGYIGSVTAACMAEIGHQVICVEPNRIKVDLARQGKSPVKEPGLESMFRNAVREQRLRSVEQGTELVADSDVSLICVGTPSAADHSPVLTHLEDVAKNIGEGLAQADSYHVVAVRSTVPPGTTRQMVQPILEKYSRRKCGVDFGLVSNPEFLRETTAIADFKEPSYTIIGEYDSRSGDVVEQLYCGLPAPVHRIRIEEAELLKLVGNAFHSLKVGFANEIGRICRLSTLDSHRIMRLVCSDRKLNISESYLTPGFAFGGSCLPKDLRLLSHLARRLGAQVPILEAILPSNRLQVEEAYITVHQLGACRVCIFGLGFKSKSSDLRESPVIALIQALEKDGIIVTVFDPEIQLEEMIGSNREYLEQQLPRAKEILKRSAKEALHFADAIIITQKRPEYHEILGNNRLPVLDLVRLDQKLSTDHGQCYYGLSW